MTRLRQQHSIAFQVRVAQAVLSAKESGTATQSQIALENGVSQSLVSRWVRLFQQGQLQSLPLRKARNRFRLSPGSGRVRGNRRVKSSTLPPLSSAISFDGVSSALPLQPSTNITLALFPIEERKLFDRIVALRNSNHAVFTANMREWMLSLLHDPLQLLADAASDPQTGQVRMNFKSSQGWVYSFMHRYHLSNKVVTSSSPSATRPTPNSATSSLFFIPALSQPESCVLDSVVLEFDRYILKKWEQHQYPINRIFNYDETRIWFDMPKKRTIHFKGTCHVVVKNTGSTGIGISVCLTCAGDGTRLIPLVLFKGARNGRLVKTIPDLLRRDGIEVDVAFNKASWVDEDIMLNSFILSLERQNGKQQRSLLVLDSHRAHLVPTVKQRFLQANCDIAVIPGGCTSKLQPLDVGIIKPFKDRLRECWTVWLRETEAKELQHNQKLQQQKFKRPSHLLICKWVELCWNQLDSSVFENSFRKALWERGE